MLRLLAQQLGRVFDLTNKSMTVNGNGSQDLTKHPPRPYENDPRPYAESLYLGSIMLLRT